MRTNRTRSWQGRLSDVLMIELFGDSLCLVRPGRHLRSNSFVCPTSESADHCYYRTQGVQDTTALSLISRSTYSPPPRRCGNLRSARQF